MKNIFFRVDASTEIGSGHVMRCLTLANILVEKGLRCEFICRKHDGHLTQFIKDKGFNVYNLNKSKMTSYIEDDYLSWLGETEENDAFECIKILKIHSVSWVVVDHYGIGKNWEKLIKNYCNKLFSIDDLADKIHDCDALLDQTYGRNKNDYIDLVPDNCDIFTGSRYALLRSEFSVHRPKSLSRREDGSIKKVMINLGGVDKNNHTLAILNILEKMDDLKNINFSVVLGSSAPNLESVQEKCLKHRYNIELLVAVDNMAELMSNCDLAIGAAGTTTWERCCLGLPTILLTLAKNQKHIVDNLSKENIALVISLSDCLESTLMSNIRKCLYEKETLANMTNSSIALVDGNGANKIALYLQEN
ncbi:UDP-2,4-diacetamido-2,4,6-trideoxy-beta-L-altropyranose hydrolase [Amylibacter sp.]|nr:UDP-2,4-diacetamido-2,4,6-trideoxy-beta-L-altropyranose hydrolase [Amylibacter sp.]